MNFTKHKISNPRLNSGFSIIEIIVYIAIFAVMSAVIINSYITIFSSFSNTQTMRNLLESGHTAMERISREIRQADSLNMGSSVFGSNPGELQLNSIDETGNLYSVEISAQGGALYLSYNGNLVGNLLGQNISVINLVFRRLVTTTSEGVKIELTLQDNRSRSLRQEKFYNTVILRK